MCLPVLPGADVSHCSVERPAGAGESAVLRTETETATMEGGPALPSGATTQAMFRSMGSAGSAVQQVADAGAQQEMVDLEVRSNCVCCW